jgi:AraC family transcriptional regulator
LTLAGGYVERHGARAVEYGEDSVAFHPPGEEHAVAIGAAEVRCLNVGIPASFVHDIHETGAHPSFARAVGGPLVWLAHRVHDETRNWCPSSHVTVEAVIVEMLGVASATGLPPLDRLPPRWLAEAEDILRHEYRSTVTVSGLASRVGVHPVHLSRSWRRYRRCSVGDAVRRLRIDEARRRLISREPLADIALDLGFADQAHFTRTFRRATGLTPRAWRRREGPAAGRRT